MPSSSGHPRTPITTPKYIKATPLKPRSLPPIGNRNSNAHHQASPRHNYSSQAGITSAEYGSKHPAYPFQLNSKRRRPQLSKEELLALYGTGNLQSRFERRRDLLNGTHLEQDGDEISDLLSQWDSDEEQDDIGNPHGHASLLKWQKEQQNNIPSVELSLEAEIQYENGVSLYEAQQYSEALEAFQFVIREVQYDKDAWFYVARCHEATGFLREAREAFETAAKYGSVEALGALALWERRRGGKRRRKGDSPSRQGVIIDEDDEMDINDALKRQLDPAQRQKLQQKKRKQDLMKRFFKKKYEQEEKQREERKRKRAYENLLSMLKEQKSHDANAQEQSQTMFSFGMQNQKSGNYEQAMAYYEQAACMGNTNAFFNMACMYRDGLHTGSSILEQPEGGNADTGESSSKPDHLMAMLLFQKAASKSHLKAKLNMGVQLERGDHGEKNLWLAFCCFRDAAKGGLMEAQSHYDRLAKLIKNRCKKRLVDQLNFHSIRILGYKLGSRQDSSPAASGILGDLFTARLVQEGEQGDPVKGRQLFKSRKKSTLSNHVPSPTNRKTAHRKRHSVASIGYGTSNQSSGSLSQLSPKKRTRNHSYSQSTSPTKNNASTPRRSLTRHGSNMKSPCGSNSSALRTQNSSHSVTSSTSSIQNTCKVSPSSKFSVKVVNGAFLNRWNQEELRMEILAQSCFILSAHHKYIVNIHSLHFEDSKNLSFVFMEKCLCSLRQFIQGSVSTASSSKFLKQHIKLLQKQNETQKQASLLELLLHVAQGMKHLHSRRILHRSLSDTTVLMGASGDRLVAKLSDFGSTTLTNHFDSKYDESRKQGGIIYSAPEILERIHYHLPFNYSKQTDIYAFGVLAHFVWTEGILPFEGVRKESGYFPPQSRFYKIHPSQESEFRRIILDKKPSCIVEATSSAREFFSESKSNVLMGQLVEECCNWSASKRPENFDHVISKLEKVRSSF